MCQHMRVCMSYRSNENVYAYMYINMVFFFTANKVLFVADCCNFFFT